MLHTFDNAEISILRDYGAVGERTWPYVEMGVFTSYFICFVSDSILDNNELITIQRHFLLSTPNGVADLIDEQNDHFKVTNINILQPNKNINNKIFELLNVAEVLRGVNYELTFITDKGDQINYGGSSSRMASIFKSG